MVEELRGFAPRLCEVAGEAAVRQVIQLGVRRAEGYGLSCCGPIRFYIELMFTLGSDFDTDPQLPWARSVLTDESVPDEMSRAGKLYEAMCEYCDHVFGPHNEYAIQALRRATEIQLEKLDVLQGGIESRGVAMMEAFYPPKASYLGEDTLRVVVQRGLDLAESHGIARDDGRLLLIGLIFCFGHGVANDRLYPWVADTLRRSRLDDPDDRAQRLYQKVRVYFDAMLRHLE